LAFSSAKAFLAQECVNLRDVLEETLRFKYGLEGSRDFFEECQARLTYIQLEVENADAADSDRLEIASALLSQLSSLLTRIERSSIGEYSWPFVEELKKIAVATCTEATAADPNAKPQFHVWSSGGLDGYAIEPEQSRPSGSRKRIHTIVLPKTLKHCVLLHSILGHEIGHAVLRCSKHQNALGKIAADLVDGTVFANPIATAKWLYSAEAPDRVKKQLSSPKLAGVNEGNFFSRAAFWNLWVEEIICDFIGLITFGPSFVAAEVNLLYSMDPSGTGIGPKHPFVGCRANYLSTGATVLGLDSGALANANHNAAYQRFWESIRLKTQGNKWFDVFSKDRIDAFTRELANLFRRLQPALYEAPGEDDLGLLLDQLANNVPPVGAEVRGAGTIGLRPMDFRHVLYAGWIVAANEPSISFLNLNRLCEHAIMQQGAIAIELGGD
jgi:hypothetical protein